MPTSTSTSSAQSASAPPPAPLRRSERTPKAPRNLYPVSSVPLAMEFDCAPQGSNFYRCRVCRLKFRRGKARDFARHLLTHREDANLHCTWPGCTLSYPTRKSLAKHLNSHQVCFPTSRRCSYPAHIHLEIIHLSCIFLLVLVVLQPTAIVLFPPISWTLA
ncbi:hypothetical protein B0H14DRAFT_954295 [Mycena olivaceomarginata]|nr:hypothetical protein B0H14DRAFT_954295 [Mycena olivaceomarginata]